MAGVDRAAAERAARREQERRRDEEELEKQRKHTEAAARIRAAQQALGPSASRLQRGTPFLCDVRFTASLPEVPCDPKLVLEPPGDVLGLARFRLTSLERGPIRDAALGEDAAGAAAVVRGGGGGGGGGGGRASSSATATTTTVGSLAGGRCVSLLTPEAYEVTRPIGTKQQQPQLEPEDAALLRIAEGVAAAAARATTAATTATTAGAGAATAVDASAAARAAAAAAAARIVGGAAAVPSALTSAAAAAAAAAAAGAGAAAAASRRPHGAELSWLMRTTYVTADPGKKATLAPKAGALALASASASEAAAAAAAAAGVPTERGALVAEIEATFEAARALDDASRPPRHPTRPGQLRAVSVRPVLPSASACGTQHVLLTLDRDPLADYVPLASFAKGKEEEEEKERNKEGGGGEGGDGGDAAAAAAAPPPAPPVPLTPDEQELLLSRAVTKSYALRDSRTGEVERFLGYMVPAAVPRLSSAAATSTTTTTAETATTAPPYSGDYDWVREFAFRVEEGAPPKDGTAAAVAAAKRTYVLDLSRRKKKRRRRKRQQAGGGGEGGGGDDGDNDVDVDGDDDDDANEPVRAFDVSTCLAAFSRKLRHEEGKYNRPSAVRVEARPETEQERAARRARRAAVLGGGGVTAASTT